MGNLQKSSKAIELFFSYSHRDEEMRDELEKHLSILKHRGLISAWHDRKIDAGEEWKGEIDEHLNSAQIILLLISADFLASKYCYDIEMKRAMERHESGEARVIPIILRHVLWKGSPFSKLQALPTNAEPIKDGKWRSVDEAFADVAEGLEEAINRLDIINNKPDRGTASINSGLKTIIVDQMCRGDFATISEAIAAATPGSKILVHSGVYDEGLIIDKPVEIMGDSDSGEVIIRADSRNAILFVTSRGKISNLILKQSGDGEWNCVDFSQGFLEIEHCDISSDSATCISIKGNAYSKIIHNKIHNGKGSGICVCENGQGLIESNDIYNNGSANVEIYGNGNPIVKSNCIFSGNGAGIYVHGDGKGVIEDNDIYCNENSGIAIYSGGNAKVIRNKIHDGKSDGITLDNSKGVIEDNDIFQNNSCGIRISNGANPMIIRNKIHDGIKQGILVDKSLGAIEENDIYGNKDDGIGIYNGGSPVIKRNNIHNGNDSGVYVSGSKGIITDNEIYSNKSAGIRIYFGGNPEVTFNHIKKNGFEGIWIDVKSGGTFKYNDLRENQRGAWDISEDSESLVKRSDNQE